MQYKLVGLIVREWNYIESETLERAMQASFAYQKVGLYKSLEMTLCNLSCEIDSREWGSNLFTFELETEEPNPLAITAITAYITRSDVSDSL